MNIEEALILDQKFVERIRNKYGPLGTEQIKGIIQEAIGQDRKSVV